MLNWLSSDEDLISIRPKEPDDNPLNMNQRQVSMMFYSSVLVLPLLIVALRRGSVVEAEVRRHMETISDEATRLLIAAVLLAGLGGAAVVVQQEEAAKARQACARMHPPRFWR